jgi:RNA polymerase sigma factor for flagellar operon FliA
MSAALPKPESTRRAAPYLVQANNAFVRRHAALVRRIARHFARRLPRHVDLNDLIQEGMMGLVEAAARYDGRVGVDFSTFAAHRVRGAILDSLREGDWSPRSLRRRARNLEKARLAVEISTCGAAKPPEVAAAMGVSIAAYHRTLRDLDLSIVSSLDEPGACGDDEMSTDVADPVRQWERDQMLRILSAVIDRLPKRERVVLWLHQDGEYLLRDIGVILALSESRICQILKRTMGRLRAAAQH